MTWTPSTATQLLALAVAAGILWAIAWSLWPERKRRCRPWSKRRKWRLARDLWQGE